MRSEKSRPALLSIALIFGLMSTAHHCRAQGIDRLEFVNAEIADIVVALGAATGNPVVADETVTGIASYFFRDVSFKEALTVFAERYDLFVSERSGVFVVSRIEVVKNAGLWTLQTGVVNLDVLLKHVFQASGSEYQFLATRNPEVGPFMFKDRSMDELLTLICDAGGVYRADRNGVFRVVDEPTGQIDYHLLVVTYDESNDLRAGGSLSNALTAPDSVQSFVGSLGNLLTLNFDVISAFGYEFAARLSTGIEENSASVVADAYLAGTDQNTVSFTSTRTSRLESGDRLHEIPVGLDIEIEGRLLAEDELTISVRAALSRFLPAGGSLASVPDTFERAVETRVRAGFGEPVALTILAEQSTREVDTGIPLLGDIPLFGSLFGQHLRQSGIKEAAIYVVAVSPERGRPSENNGHELDLLYEQFVEEFE